MQFASALCFKISCSRYRNVRLCSTCCLTYKYSNPSVIKNPPLSRQWEQGFVVRHHTCAAATQVLGFVFCFSQSLHMCVSTTYSTTKDCCKMVPVKTSAWTVTFTFSRLE